MLNMTSYLEPIYVVRVLSLIRIHIYGTTVLDLVYFVIVLVHFLDVTFLNLRRSRIRRLFKPFGSLPVRGAVNDNGDSVDHHDIQ